MPVDASFVYCTLGKEYDSRGDYWKAIEYHTQYLEIAKEVGDRAGEGGAYGNLGVEYDSLGDYYKASTTRSTWRLRRRWATGRGRCVREPRRRV